MFVTVIFLTCFCVINSKYDRLSRYPYEDENARYLIKKYMSDEDIEYIIDYAITPGYFIKYIECPDFNIYHVDAYDKAGAFYWYADKNDVVKLVETIYNFDNSEDIDYYMSLLGNYHFDEMSYYLNHQDEFEGLMLSDNPSEFSDEIESDKTVGIYAPRDMFANGNVVLNENALYAYETSLNEINETFNCSNFGGIKESDSYLSYKDLKERNANPGRNIHQLGNSVDIDLSNSIFLNNADYVTMKDIFESHGFEIDECMFSEFHLTYKGDIQ